MTSRQVYEAMLVELNKVEAPSMLLEDFNYFFNKAITRYINKKYNIYDTNQQVADDIRVLKSTAILTPIAPTSSVANAYGETLPTNGISQGLYGGVVEFELPTDYLHILNCICNFEVSKTFKCYNAGDSVQFAARRLTSDMWSQIINNFYMRPMYRRPYFFIHNVNTVSNGSTQKNIPTNTTIDMVGDYSVDTDSSTADISNLPRTISIGIGSAATNHSAVEKETANRYGNSEPVRLEIRYGKDNSIFKLNKIYVDYIKTPQFIRLTQEQLDLTEDTSQIMEFPDYVCQEIINELVTLMMENSSDPRLQTNIPINQTIASPAQQQTPQKK